MGKTEEGVASPWSTRFSISKVDHVSLYGRPCFRKEAIRSVVRKESDGRKIFIVSRTGRIPFEQISRKVESPAVLSSPSSGLYCVLENKEPEILVSRSDTERILFWNRYLLLQGLFRPNEKPSQMFVDGCAKAKEGRTAIRNLYFCNCRCCVCFHPLTKRRNYTGVEE
jgi:hypothetical protein